MQDQPTDGTKKPREDDFENRTPQFPREPDGYVRRSDLLKAVGAITGILGSVIGGWGFVDRKFESLRIEIRNERVERLNSETLRDQRIDSCCRRR